MDYVAKHRLGRLPAAVERALVRSERRRERHAAAAALARSGRLFEAVFANARDAMLIVGDERRVVDANPAAAEMFGLPMNDLANLHVDDLMPEVSRVDAPRRWDKFVSAGERRGEIELLRSDGALVATEYTAVANFVPGRHIFVLRDIRVRRAAEAAADRHCAQQKAISDLGEDALRGENLDLLLDSAATRVAETLGAEIASVMELRSSESCLRGPRRGRPPTGTRGRPGAPRLAGQLAGELHGAPGEAGGGGELRSGRRASSATRSWAREGFAAR